MQVLNVAPFRSYTFKKQVVWLFLSRKKIRFLFQNLIQFFVRFWKPGTRIYAFAPASIDNYYLRTRFHKAQQNASFYFQRLRIST